MKLSDFENSISPVIMQRGQDYYDSKAVQELEETETQFWQAWVEGTQTYDIEISLNKQTIKGWYCTCPYDGPVCKHVAATLLSIRESLATDKQSKTKKLTKQQQLNNVLDQLSKAELKTLLSQQLKNDRAARDKLLLQFQHLTGSKESIVSRYRGLFKKVVARYSDHGFIDYRDARGFTEESFDLLDALIPSTMPPTDCMDTCFAFFEILEADVVNSIDDSDGGTGELMFKAAEILEEAYQALAKTEQANYFRKVLYWDFESELENYGLGQYLEGLTPQWASGNPELQTEYLNALDKTLKTTTSKYRLVSLNQHKLKVLSNWGRQAEADALAQEKMDIPQFRQLFVDKAIKAKNFVEAWTLIEAGIQIAEKQNLAGVVANWRKQQLEIAEQTGDTVAIRRAIVTLLQDSRFSIELYRKLKATFSNDEWEKVRHDYAKKILSERQAAGNQAEIHLEEGELRQLFDLILSQKYGSVIMFKGYIDALAPAFPEETVEYYAKIIRGNLKTTGRNVYEQAVQEIKHLQKLPTGSSVADKLIKDVMLEYGNRPSMLEIFRNAFKDSL